MVEFSSFETERTLIEETADIFRCIDIYGLNLKKFPRKVSTALLKVNTFKLWDRGRHTVCESYLEMIIMGDDKKDVEVIYLDFARASPWLQAAGL